MLCLALAAAMLAGAASPEAAQPGASGILRLDRSAQAGSTVGVSWGLEDEGPEFDEMELVLSLDGGRTFPVRVTGRIDPGVRAVLWTVPSLPTLHARLALRVGEDEPAEEERLAGLSAEFAIAASPGIPLEQTFRVAGEERTREALEGAPPPPRGDALEEASEERIAPADPFDLPARSGPSASVSGRDAASRREHTRAPRHSPAGARRPAQSPLQVPLRL
jgi:hypothetical protein